MARDSVIFSYDEAMAVCLLPLRDTRVEEARLMVELILGRTDE